MAGLPPPFEPVPFERTSKWECSECGTVFDVNGAITPDRCIGICPGCGMEYWDESEEEHEHFKGGCA